MFNKKLTFIFLIAIIIFGCSEKLFAEKIAIVYTGDSVASLYHCNCPVAPDGGVSRRATKIKELRKEYPNLLVLDSGNYFASGFQDVDKATTVLDKKRTQINLLAMQTMGYDAVGIGSDEFNFGREFLIDMIAKSKLDFVSSNLDLPKVKPFLIKRFGKIKVGIIGISPLSLAFDSTSKKSQDIDAAIKLIKENVKKLKHKGVDIIVLLSQLGTELDQKIADEVNEINIIVATQGGTKNRTSEKLGSAVYLRPYLWARTLGFIELEIKDKEIEIVSEDAIAMSSDIPDDNDIKSFLPECFRAEDCFEPGMIVRCESAGEKNAKCTYQEDINVPLTIIIPDDCKSCKPEKSLEFISRYVPRVEITYLKSDENKAKGIINKLGINMLPVFLFGEEISQHHNFNLLSQKKIIQKKDNYYMINQGFLGISYFLNRKHINNRLDLFISLRDKNAKSILERTRKALENSGSQIDFHIHFLAKEYNDSSSFSAPFGSLELEEDKMALCAIKIYPEKMWDYLFCHVDNLENSLLDNCVETLDMDKTSIKQCFESKDSVNLLKDNINLSEDLRLHYGPLFLFENQEIFGISKDTSVEELERIIKK